MGINDHILRALPGRSRPLEGDGAGSRAAYGFLAILLGLVLVRAVAYALLNPAFASPDEIQHFKYVAFLATGGASGEAGPESVQPPGYYVLMVPAYWLMAGQSAALQLLAIRLSSTLLVLGTVVFAWLAARAMKPNDVFLPVIAAAIVGLHPENTIIGASANNDSAANLMAAVLVYLTIALISGRSWWSAPAMVVALGIGLMTKAQILPIAAISAGILLLLLVQRALLSRAWGPLAGLAVAAAIGGAALWTREGARLVIKAQIVPRVLGHWPALIEAAQKSGIEPFVYQIKSFWAAFLGESVQPVPIWYIIPGALVALGIAGYATEAARRPRGNWPPCRAMVIRAMLLLVIVADWGPLYLYFLGLSDPAILVSSDPYILQTMNGRYLLVLLVPLALLIAEGCSLLARGRARVPIALSTLAAIAVFDLSSFAALAGYHSWPADINQW